MNSYKFQHKEQTLILDFPIVFYVLAVVNNVQWEGHEEFLLQYQMHIGLE